MASRHRARAVLVAIAVLGAGDGQAGALPALLGEAGAHPHRAPERCLRQGCVGQGIADRLPALEHHRGQL
eukprot:9241071-Alexandrium_andersonii.AAC.1